MKRAVTVAALVLVAVTADATTVSGVVRTKGNVARDAVVYLESAAGPVAGRTSPPAVMDQKSLAFIPRVLPVTAGTTVEFTNSDDIQHNVFSPTRLAGAFDLGHYSRGEVRRVVMQHPGDVVVLCNIHMEMEAHILVVRDPFFAVTDADGDYQIADVPPGRYTVKVWQRSWLPFEQTLEVKDDAPIALDLAVSR